MKEKTRKVSIICAAHNEEETFEKHLQSLVGQSYKNFEVIIVNDGSTDNTGEIGKRFAKKYKNISYYEIKNIPGFGCVRPRLEALKHATGTIYCWVDADAYYDKDYLKIGVKRLLSSKKIGAVVPRMHFWDANTFISKHKSLMYEITFNDPEQINKEIKVAYHSPWFIKKEVYDEVGGFKITWAYIEDVYLARNIMNAGYEMVHEPKAHWYHRLERKTGEIIRKNWDIGRMYSTEKNFLPVTLIKVGYFTLPILAIPAGFIFSPWIFLILPLHILPLIFKSYRLYLRAKRLKIKECKDAFHSPIVSYFVNIPNVLGFYYGLIRPYKKK